MKTYNTGSRTRHGNAYCGLQVGRQNDKPVLWIGDGKYTQCIPIEAVEFDRNRDELDACEPIIHDGSGLFVGVGPERDANDRRALVRLDGWGENTRTFRANEDKLLKHAGNAVFAVMKPGEEINAWRKTQNSKTGKESYNLVKVVYTGIPGQEVFEGDKYEVDRLVAPLLEKIECIPMFNYCSYWGMWSRVLSDKHTRGPFVEVNLTPISCSDNASAWNEEVAPIRIRAHCTSRSRGDKCVAELPLEVKAQMLAHLGEKLTERLLTEVIVPQIDWDLYKKKCNGGANLEDIRRADCQA